MKPQRSVDKLTQLMDKSDTGRRLADFINDPLITQFFDTFEASLTQALVDAAAGATDTDTIRARALALGAVRNLRTYLKNGAADGLRAEEAYAKLVKEQHHV